MRNCTHPCTTFESSTSVTARDASNIVNTLSVAHGQTSFIQPQTLTDKLCLHKFYCRPKAPASTHDGIDQQKQHQTGCALVRNLRSMGDGTHAEQAIIVEWEYSYFHAAPAKQAAGW